MLLLDSLQDISRGNLVINHDLTAVERVNPIPVPFLSTWDFRIAFIDFELSTKYIAGSDTSTWVDSGFCGNYDFVAPEVLASEETKAEYAVLPTDVCFNVISPHSLYDLYRC